MCGEDSSAKHGITREQQDTYALESYRRSAAAVGAGRSVQN
jgi:acetyl-CoA acetyltransferase